MAYRPYPNADRALQQLARRVQPTRTGPVPRHTPVTGTILAAVRRYQRAALASFVFPVDEYRLSTR